MVTFTVEILCFTHSILSKPYENVDFDEYFFSGGFGDFYTMKRSQQPHPDVLFNSLLEGYDQLVSRVSALERKLMENRK